MKKKGQTNRKRILIFYTLAIVLPCTVLGFLAFRGIKNDQALLEAELRKNLSDACQQIIVGTDAYISSVENSFDEIISFIAIPKETIFTDSMLNRFCARHQAVAGILFISPSGITSLLNNRLLYVPDGLLTVPGGTDFQSMRKVIEKGWQFEFMEKNNLKALKYYQSVLHEVTGKETRGEILNAIARLQKKTGKFAEAIQTYDRIWNDYTQVFIQKKIPLGAVALHEKSLLFLSEKDTIPALETNHLLMCKLLKPEWELGFSQYMNFLENMDEIVSACENSHMEEIQNRLQKIHCVKDSLSKSEKHTESLLALLGKGEIFPEQAKPDRNSNNTRHKIRINGESFFIPLVQGNDQGQWGIIMDTRHILNITVHDLILEFAEKLNFYWEVTGVNGDVLLKSEYVPESTSPVYAVFPSDLPSYTLTLYPEDSGLFVSLFHRGKSLFFSIFVVITIILVCGLFFTLQTINNELNLSRMKSTFMSTVSHEFKSPLTSIRQMAEMLVRGRVTSPERQQKYYATILQQSERLSHLIDNILDFSKIEEGQKVFRFEKAEITQVVTDIVELFRELTANSGFQIRLAISGSIPDVVFDREAVTQVIYNLVDNSCKYSGDSKIVDVQLYSTEDRIVISVRDYGIGIRKEDQDKIFSRFYRAGEELTQKVKGSGLGLAIVKQIIDAHHGEITVKSSPGEGSTFTVLIPSG